MSEGIRAALEIQRTTAPPQWPAALERVPEEFREEATEYLKSMAGRLRVLRGLARDYGVRLSDFPKLRGFARFSKFNNIGAYTSWCRQTGKNPYERNERRVHGE